MNQAATTSLLPLTAYIKDYSTFSLPPQPTKTNLSGQIDTPDCIISFSFRGSDKTPTACTACPAFHYSPSIILGRIFKVILFFILLCPSAAAEKPGDSLLIKIRGSALFSGDFYNGTSSDSAFRPRLQPFIARAIIRAEIELPGSVSIPFELYGSSQKVDFRQPFNQFGASPRFGSWLTLHGGFFSYSQSDLTFGDLRLCGGGIEAAFGNFHFSSVYGLGGFAREPVASASYPGEYSRRFAAASIGYGKPSANMINLNVAYSVDDSSTIKTATDSLRPPPRENLVATISFAGAPTDWLSFGGEAGASIFTSDTRLPAIESAFHLPKFLVVTPRASTQADGAAKITAAINANKEFNIKAEAKWTGPGFVVLGWRALQNDVLDFTLSPTTRLAEGRLIIRASGGVRFNNLRDNRFAVTRRTIGSLFTAWQISPLIGIDLQYSNYGMRSAHLNDTLRIQNIFQNLSISPRFSFDWLEGVNSLTANYTMQDVDDKNIFSRDFTRSVAHVFSIVHSIILPNTLNFSTMALYNSFSAVSASTKVVSITETVGKSYFNDAFSASLTAGVNIIIMQSAERQFTASASVAYFEQSLGSFSLNASVNSFVAAQLTLSPSFREFTANMAYRVAF